MSPQISICLSPFEPNVATTESLVLSVSPPYSEDEVTLTINPNITEYIEKAAGDGIQIAQLTQEQATDETITVTLTLAQRPEQRFAYGGKLYSVRFMGTARKTQEGQDFLCFNFHVETEPLTKLHKEGSVAFSLTHDHSDWMSDKNGYKFQARDIQGVYIQPVKEPDGTFKLSINGPLGQSLTLRHDVSSLATPKLRVAITWKDDSLKLYLNGELAKEQTIEEALA